MKTFLRFRQKIGQGLLVGSLVFTTVAMNGCDAIYWNEQESLQHLSQKKEIVVLTTASPLIYNKPRRGDAFGIDSDLLHNFASTYNLNLRYVVLPDEESVMRALKKGEGDIAAARLRKPAHNSGLLTGPAYEETYLSLFCRSKQQIQNIKDLNHKKVALLSKDNHQGLAHRLQQLAPDAQIQIIDDQKTKKLIADLSRQRHDCVIAEDLIGSFYLRFHRNLEKVTAVTASYSLNWLLTPDNQDLLLLIQIWYQRASREDEIVRTLDRYKTYLNTLNHQDVAKLFRSIRSILPHYRNDFKKSAKAHQLPWQLVASVAYQESHWNPNARSFTGVLGMMQLTTDTALHMGIEDRTDPQQSIWGGSRYLRYLLNRMPHNLNPQDRLALALAAYNVGLAHLKDAQKLAERLGRNPVSWHHMREILPLLADPDYADQLPYGPARGYETVDFVERVKAFYNIMTIAG